MNDLLSKIVSGVGVLLITGSLAWSFNTTNDLKKDVIELQSKYVTEKELHILLKGEFSAQNEFIRLIVRDEINKKK